MIFSDSESRVINHDINELDNYIFNSFKNISFDSRGFNNIYYSPTKKEKKCSESEEEKRRGEEKKQSNFDLTTFTKVYKELLVNMDEHNEYLKNTNKEYFYYNFQDENFTSNFNRLKNIDFIENNQEELSKGILTILNLVNDCFLDLNYKLKEISDKLIAEKNNISITKSLILDENNLPSFNKNYSFLDYVNNPSNNNLRLVQGNTLSFSILAEKKYNVMPNVNHTSNNNHMINSVLNFNESSFQINNSCNLNFVPYSMKQKQKEEEKKTNLEIESNLNSFFYFNSTNKEENNNQKEVEIGKFSEEAEEAEKTFKFSNNGVNLNIDYEIVFKIVYFYSNFVKYLNSYILSKTKMNISLNFNEPNSVGDYVTGLIGKYEKVCKENFHLKLDLKRIKNNLNY